MKPLRPWRWPSPQRSSADEDHLYPPCASEPCSPRQHRREGQSSGRTRSGRRVRPTINRLGEFPEIGRPGQSPARGSSRRPAPFVVIYRVKQERTVILRVLHERQSYP
ncbi:type II toxin-antitoxin system RelE/ParE family toxin [Microvirga massiliensis]|uniref:type II toxin-antitoxin system RelE/ParE family toxin n=1 Tax=Microvirga massiliensis TaxID=1033741 RepID=UPI003CC7D5CB